jgi:hypothetical protein
MTGWLILRVSRGNPIKIAEAIRAVGLADAYCPKHTTRRRHPFDRRRVIEVRKPLIPGYAFTDRHFDSALVATAMLAAARARAGHNPVVADVRVRWLTIDERLLQIERADLDAMSVRDADAPTTLEEIIAAFHQCVRGVLPSRFISFADWQALRAPDGAQVFVAPRPPQA